LSAGRTTPSERHAPGFRAIRFNMDWITRPLFGVLLAVFVIVVVWSGVRPFAMLVALGCTLAAVEWNRCVGQGQRHLADTAVTAATIALSELVLLYDGHFWVALAVVALGTAASLGLALAHDEHPYWQAAGTPYLAIPALCLVALCEDFRSWTVIGLLLIVWATDTGALIFGNLIGGPRLAPKISPGKTWAGTIGGSIVAALVFAFYLDFVFGHFVPMALVFAFFFSFAAHAGDLVESLVKRRFGVKNSGSIIPGHGGVLDRIDSTLMAAPVMALLVFVAHFDPLFGVHA
jgi:phosphatidate cytidylyltransferase